MDDLVIRINIDETNQHHNLIIDTFWGTNKNLKKQQYSGQLRKMNIFAHQISQKGVNELLTILKQNETRQLAPHKHMISEQSILSFFSIINNFITYYSSQKSAMYRIISFFDKPVELIVERSSKNKKFEAYIKFGQTTKSISMEAKLVALNKYTFLFDHNTVYQIQKLINLTLLPLNVSLLNFIIEHALKPTESQLSRFLHQVSINITSQFAEKTITICNSLPTPVLYLHLNKKVISAYLKFRYNAIELDYSSTEEYVIDGLQKIYRDKKIESDYVNILSKNNWKKSNNNVFIYQGQFIIDDVDLLLEKGFIVLSERKNKVIASSAYSYNMSYGIDWFYLNTSIRIDDKTYSLAKILNSKNIQQGWIEIDNQIVLLPKELIKNKNILSVNNGKIGISKKNIGNALELAKTLSINKIDNIESLTAFENIQLNIPTDLLMQLRAYQVEGVKWLLYLYKNNFGGCLADDMGLGKTIQVIAFLSDEKIKNKHPSLVIVPKTLLFNWKNELKKFNPELRVEIYHGSTRVFDFSQKKHMDVILTTYGTVLHDIEQLSRLSYNCLVIDEAQYIKNNNSKTYKAVSLLSSHLKLALTGTPIENNIGELWSLMNLLNPQIWGKKKDFINQYLTPQKIEQLKTKISPFVLRRTKKQVLHELPEKIESVVYCDMDEEQSTLYNALVLNIKQEMDKLPGRFEIKTNAYILRGLMHLRQVCCHPKLLDAQYNINRCKTSAKFEVMQEIVNQLYNEDEKIVIFSQFTTMLKIIEKWLKQEQYQYFYLDGQTNNRETVISEFEQSANGVLLISLKAGGVGINLTSANCAVIYDPWWNPAAENQAADRLYRIGQKRNVTIYKLITVNSIEEKVDELKKMKLDLFNQVLEGQDMIESLTIEDLKRLLS